MTARWWYIDFPNGSVCYVTETDEAFGDVAGVHRTVAWLRQAGEADLALAGAVECAVIDEGLDPELYRLTESFEGATVTLTGTPLDG